MKTLMWTNKTYFLGHFDPKMHPDFVQIDSMYCYRELYMLQEAYQAFVEMAKAALADSVHLKIISATRNFSDPQPLTLNSQPGRIDHVRAFLFRYFGSGGQWSPCDAPVPTITVKDRLALGIVLIAGEFWQIIDIGMRMLTPRELFLAQGFPSTYKIEAGEDGRPLSKAAQVARCGNSVPPHFAEALVRANVPGMCI